MQISEQILNMKDDCVKIRRDLHRIPEIGFELHQTHEYIKPLIEQTQPDELRVLAGAGFKAVYSLSGRTSIKTIIRRHSAAAGARLMMM